MYLSFELSMPNNNSWNGRWSGEGKRYVIVKNFRREPFLPNGKRLAGSYHYYNFGDGWGAAVTVRECTGPAARSLKKQSSGFCGYGWMVDEILTHGKILTLQERAALKSKPSDSTNNEATGQVSKP